MGNQRSMRAPFDVLPGIVMPPSIGCNVSLSGCSADDTNMNCYAARIVSGKRGIPIECYGLEDVLTHMHGRITLLFADCEGCLPSFVANHRAILEQHPELRL